MIDSRRDSPEWKIEAGRRVQRWLEVMDACEQFLLAGLRRHVGPNGDLNAAYHAWYAERMREHDTMMENLIRTLREAEARHAE